MKLRLSGLLVYLLLTPICMGYAWAPQPPEDIPPATLLDLKLALVSRINQDRTQIGLQPLLYLDDLSQLADAHCREMIQADYVSHWNQAGLKPYMRYSLGGIADHTAENISSLKATNFVVSADRLRKEIIERHASFLAEAPPNDLHRRSILDPRHTHVGIGLAYDGGGFKMIEVFADRYVNMDALPGKATLSDRLTLGGKVLDRANRVEAISIFYEPPPMPLTVAELQGMGSYQFPDEEQVLRPRLEGPLRYEDGSPGQIELGPDNSFVSRLAFIMKKPGVYTVAVWVRKKSGETKAFLATNTSIFVEG